MNKSGLQTRTRATRNSSKDPEEKGKKGFKQTSMMAFIKQRQEKKDNNQLENSKLKKKQKKQEEIPSEDNQDEEEEEEEEESSNGSEENQNNNESSKSNESSSEENEEKADEEENNNSKKDKNRNKRKAAQQVKSYKKLNSKGKANSEEDLDQLGEDQDGPIINNNIEGEEEDEVEVDEEEILEKLPRNKRALEKMLEKVDQRLNYYKDLFFQEYNEGINQKSNVDDNAIPICSDIRTFDFQALKDSQMRHGGKMFDVIMMDPPWQLSTSQPSRGVAIAYDSLGDDMISNMPIETLQKDGYIFIWAINAKYRITVKIMEKWGYKLVDEVAWVKKTVNGKIAKGHGFYLQHAKESCLIGVKGDVSGDRFKKNIASDVIFSERRGQSQKPEEIYEYAEQLVPNGFYLEIFGRRNNLRSNWVTIGNEL